MSKPIFFHNPKAGGTAINLALGDKVFRQGHAHPAQFKDQNKKWFNTAFKFAIVRNPWDRFLSTYTFAKQDKNIFHNNINPKEAPFGEHPDYHIASKISFEEYVFLFCKTGKKLKHPGLSYQHLYTHLNGEKFVDMILKFENLQVDFDSFCEQISFAKVELKKLNVSREDEYHNYYAQESWAIVEEYYAKDITLFNYEHDHL